MGDYFVSEAFDKGLNNYIEYRNRPNGVAFNSFLVIVMRSLVSIYKEHNLIIPFQENNRELLCNNLYAFGADKELIDKFINDLNLYLVDFNNKIVPNSKFIDVEIALIDLYMIKKANYGCTTFEEEEFKNLLYSPFAVNELIISENFLNTKNNYEIMNYFNLENQETVTRVKEDGKILLSPDAYKVVEQNFTDICLLDSNDLAKINEAVYEKLEVDKSETNFDYQFDKALTKFYEDKQLQPQGNGFVDVLLVTGMMSVVGMVVTIGVLLFS